VRKDLNPTFFIGLRFDFKEEGGWSSSHPASSFEVCSKEYKSKGKGGKMPSWMAIGAFFSLLREKRGDVTDLGMYLPTTTSCFAQGLLKFNPVRCKEAFF
jgi:hypothetical protein